MIGPFLSMEVMCGFSKIKENDELIGDWVRQLGETGEYFSLSLDQGNYVVLSDLKFGAPRW
jgi:hypothetical protein